MDPIDIPIKNKYMRVSGIYINQKEDTSGSITTTNLKSTQVWKYREWIYKQYLSEMTIGDRKRQDIDWGILDRLITTDAKDIVLLIPLELQEELGE